MVLEVKFDLITNLLDEFNQLFPNVPKIELMPILAEIQHTGSLGVSKWYEVVYYEKNEWHSYAESKTFSNGEKVLNWKYCKDIEL